MAPTSENGVPTGATAADQLAFAQNALKALELRFAPKHPDVIRLKRIVAELQAKADEEALTAPVSGQGRPLTPVEIARRNRIEQVKAEIENIDRQLSARAAEQIRLCGGAQPSPTL